MHVIDLPWRLSSYVPHRFPKGHDGMGVLNSGLRCLHQSYGRLDETQIAQNATHTRVPLDQYPFVGVEESQS